MTKTRQHSARARGFTLIELLIVVIILAILAAIVVPQFANTTVDAKEATLDSNLSTVRAAIEQYKVQHSVYPAAVAATGTGAAVACGTGGVVGTGAIDTSQALIDQLTLASDKNGHTCSLADPVNYKFGPYIRGKLPNEPINEIGSLPAAITTTNTGAKLTATVATGGWAYDDKSGEFIMRSNAADSKGTTKYFEH